jgi:type IV pilus assembly protein PilN
MIRVNLLKADAKEGEKRAVVPEAEGKEVKKKKGPNTNLIILAAIVILGGLALIQKRALDRERVLLRAATDEQGALAPVIAKLDEVEQRKIQLELKVGLIQSLRQQQSLPIRVLESLSSCLPDWVWLTEVTYRNRSVDIKGRAISNVQISDFMDALQKTGLYEAINLANSQQQVIGTDAVVNFSLIAVLPPMDTGPAGGQSPGRQQP